MKMLHWGDCKATIEQQLVEIKILKEKVNDYQARYIESEKQLASAQVEIYALVKENTLVMQTNRNLADRATAMEKLNGDISPLSKNITKKKATNALKETTTSVSGNK
jgi:hypothetical protein